MTPDLPPGWQRLALREACSLITDGSHISPPTASDGYPYVTVRDVHGGRIHFGGAAHIARSDFEALEAGGCRPVVDDVLFSKDGTVGRVARVRDSRPFVVLSSLAILRPKQNVVSPGYLEHALAAPHVQAQVISSMSGTAIRRVVLRSLREVQVPVPPIDEQRRIVEILEDHLSSLSAAQSSLESASRRATMLPGAHIASLVAEMDATHDIGARPLRELLAAQHGGRLLSQGWSPRCESRSALGQSEWGVLKTTAIQDGAFIPEENKALPASLRPRPELAVTAGDILMTRAGPRARCGVSCLVPSSDPRLMLSDKMYRLRADEGRVRPDFLALVLRSPQVHKAIDRMKTGISDSGVNLTQEGLLGLAVPVPSLERQDEIVATSAVARANGLAMQREADHALKRLLMLRRALLAAAFSGRFTGRSSDLDLAEEMALA